MRQDINEALVNLEKSLQNIDSARNQVEQVVSNSKELQRVVSEFTTTFNDLASSVSSLKELVNAEKEAVSHDVNDAVTKLTQQSQGISSEFSRKTQDVLDRTRESIQQNKQIITSKLGDLQNEIAHLKELEHSYEDATQTVSSLEDRISTLAGDIRDSQASQDHVLDDISSKINTYNTNVDTKVSTVTSLMTQLNGKSDGIQTDVTSIKNETESSGHKIDSLSSTVVTKSEFNEYRQSEKIKLDSLKKQIDIRGDKNNKITLLCGIVLLVVAIISHFL